MDIEEFRNEEAGKLYCDGIFYLKQDNYTEAYSLFERALELYSEDNFKYECYFYCEICRACMLQLDYINKESNLMQRDNCVTIHLADGVYNGDVKGEVPNGCGRIIYDDGNVLNGLFVDGVCVSGILKYTDIKVLYVGELKDNIKQGAGVAFGNDFRIFEGTWKDDFLHGECCVSSKNGLEKSFWQNGELVEKKKR